MPHECGPSLREMETMERGSAPRQMEWAPSRWDRREPIRSSHFQGAFQTGGPATNKHYTNTLRGGSLAFHDTSDKFVTTNDAFFNANASFMPAPPRPRVDPNFRFVNNDPRQGMAVWQKSENYRR